MNTPGKNAKRKAKRRAIQPPTQGSEREPSGEDARILETLAAAKKVDVEAEWVYPQPTRCKNCGNWCYVMAYLGDKVCGNDCSEAVQEREAKREAKS